MKIAKRTKTGWTEYQENKSKKTCDDCGAELWAGPGKSIYCNAKSDKHTDKARKLLKLKILTVGTDDLEIEKIIGCQPLEMKEDAIQFIFNEDNAWIVTLPGVKYWAIAYNEDGIFGDVESAFTWLKKNL